MAYYLAIDIGASSGRHILGEVRDGKLVLEEIYRFENGMDNSDGSLTWNVDRLFDEVVEGIKKCAELSKIPKSMAIDTWGVDYVLIDEQGDEILPAVAYRDGRTAEVIDEVESIISREELYSKTGIQRQGFNTIYQLYHDKKSGKLDRAEHMLMIPEYLAYKLTGVMKNEYTEASTSSLVNAESCEWGKEIISRLGLKQDIFGELNMPMTFVGNFKEEILKRVGFDTRVVFCPTHDTASAVTACPMGENAMYISSGTWSLAGVEISSPITSKDAMEKGFTNEGGINRRYRFLKNIMGMWLFQNIRKNTDKKFSYDEMMHMAEKSSFKETVNVNDPEFVAPDNMIEAFRQKLGKPELPLEDVLSCVYHSLASLYSDTANEIESIVGKKIDEIHIMGGGGADVYLNRLTAEKSGRDVFAGIKEATATGNLLAQIMADDGSITLDECRNIVRDSFAVSKYSAR